MMDTTFSMVRVRNVMRRDLIENWKSNLYGLLGILQPSFPDVGLFVVGRGLGRDRFSGGLFLSSFLWQYVRGNWHGSEFCDDFLRFPNHEMHGQQGEAHLLFAASGYEAGEVLFTGGIGDHRYVVDGAGSLAGIGAYSLPVAAFV